MALRKPKPTSPGRRFATYPDFAEVTRSEPEKSLTEGLNKSGGRDTHGRKTSRHRGGGAKRRYRKIDFKRRKDGVPAKVATIEYDPNRSAYIALLNYSDGEKRYILAPQKLKKGDVVQTSDNPPFNVGSCMKLKFMPLGSSVYNIELIPGRGGKLVRSAGLSAQLMARSGGYATLRMPSGEVRMVNENCRATFGAVSNPEHNLRVEGKAGRMRWKGVRPTVRGTAMNPVDHPHGGGEGKHKGNTPQTPWGLYTKGLVTRSKKKSNKLIVKSRRKK